MDALLDTSALIDPVPHPTMTGSAVSIVSVVELIAGINATEDPAKRAARAARLDDVLTTYDPFPVDESVATAYRLVDAAIRTAGRQPRARLADLLTAATAIAHGLPLVTHNPADFRGMEDLITLLPGE